MTRQTKKHNCPDCHHCQWCSDERCHQCLKTAQRPRLSIREQIELFEKLNRKSPDCPCGDPEKKS